MNKRSKPVRIASLTRLLLGLTSLLAVSGCTDPTVVPLEENALTDVTETEARTVPFLSAPVHVIRTEANVPHIYAENKRDLAYVQGFTIARDRYFMMDLARRLGRGTVSELLGDGGLAIDQNSRGTGMAAVAQSMVNSWTPDTLEVVDAFAAGINAYIADAQALEIPAPSELKLAQTLLGVADETSLMQPFDRIDVAAMTTVVLYQSGFETGDVNRAAGVAQMVGHFAGAPLEDLRQNGMEQDIYGDVKPVKDASSAPGFNGSPQAKKSPPPKQSGATGTADLKTLRRLVTRLDEGQARLGRLKDADHGSNAWAVSGAASASGGALLAGDGHLSLAVPSILYQLGLDTQFLGGGDTHQLGLTIPGMPFMPIGTNGQVAWSQTQLAGDITDWYQESLQLNSDGVPVRSLHDGEWQYLQRRDERYVIADVPALESVGRTETWRRYLTQDGRYITAIEGRDATADETLAAGETLVNLLGDYVVPQDLNGDGIVSAVSFDYTGLDSAAVLRATDAIGHADSVDEFGDALKGMVAYSQNFIVADQAGDILYSAYQPFPCRDYLERNADGTFTEGSDPRQLLDGTRYGGFTIPIKDGVVDEAQGSTDPYACVVPFSAIPGYKSPGQGYVMTANNDPAAISLDGDILNDDYYIGGPWDTGFRADTIVTELEDAIETNSADIARMAAIQGNNRSRLGDLFLAPMLEAVTYAKALNAPTDPADQRIASAYAAEAAAIDEVKQRLEAWRDAGFKAKSGVETFYNTPAAGDLDDAVATMIFNAWLPRVVKGVFDDETIPDVFQKGGTHGRVRALNRFFLGRGAGNTQNLASFNPATEESAFFDVLSTTDIETSREVVITGLVDALLFLRSAPEEGNEDNGGFGTSDMAQWIWGLRHQARFESLLAGFVTDEFSAFTEGFAISTGRISLTGSTLPSSDPRRPLEWFPRDGDNFGVDAANPGFGGERFTHGSGPVMRMVVELKDGKVTGQNIIPGGQSALINSEYFDDQARLWLANETLPMRFSVEDVVAGATGRETFRP